MRTIDYDGTTIYDDPDDDEHEGLTEAEANTRAIAEEMLASQGIEMIEKDGELVFVDGRRIPAKYAGFQPPLM